MDPQSKLTPVVPLTRTINTLPQGDRPPMQGRRIPLWSGYPDQWETTGSKVPSRWYELQISCLTLRRGRVDEWRCIIRVIDQAMFTGICSIMGRTMPRKALRIQLRHNATENLCWRGTPVSGAEQQRHLSMRTPLPRYMRVSPSFNFLW